MFRWVVLLSIFYVCCSCIKEEREVLVDGVLAKFKSAYYEDEAKPKPAKEAFAMLIYNMTDVTSEMVFVPLYSLRRLGVNVPIVVLVTPDIDLDLRRQLYNKLKVRVKQVTPIEIPSHLHGLMQAREYLLLFTKLHSYHMFEYERVCIIDMDMIALHNPEEVLKYPTAGLPFAASKGQCGFFCVRPSPTQFLHLLIQTQYTIYPSGLGDQTFYQQYFADLAWAIPHQFNTIAIPAEENQWTFWRNDTYIPLVHPFIGNEVQTVEQVVMYHFNGIKRKPWLRKPPRPDERYEHDFSNDVFFLAKWWEIREEMRKKIGI